MKKNQKGFTLVELMIVVAIIGILAAIAIPKFADMLEKSREGATKGNLSSVNSGISLYVSDNQGQVPNTLDTATYTLNGQSYAAFVPQYMDNIPGVKATAKKKSTLGGGTWSSPSSVVVTITNGTSPVIAGTVVVGGVGWLYSNATAAGSDFWVNSIAGDMKSTASTFYPYTMYGYE
jgi:prepilin-type N-terminal cleavage/methylation domain-containing protein